jgi:hypothetical protein
VMQLCHRGANNSAGRITNRSFGCERHVPCSTSCSRLSPIWRIWPYLWNL